MKKSIILVSFVIIAVFGVQAQTASNFRVKYMVTHDATKNVFTAWVVPDYNTPNANNGDTEEKGATAQFTIKVPAGFSITEIHDIKGYWDKKPIKVDGRSMVKLKSKLKNLGYDKNTPIQEYSYYIVGKDPMQTNYGKFIENEPVALFSFKGYGGSPDDVLALEVNDPFIKLANETMALNVGSSFYSRSGQRPTVSAIPLEQFLAPTSLGTVISKAARKAGVEISNISETDNFSSIVYPNPSNDMAILKYFSAIDEGSLSVYITDIKGNDQLTQKVKTKLGFNLIPLSVSDLKDGTYLVRSIQGKDLSVNKIVKKLD